MRLNEGTRTFVMSAGSARRSPETSEGPVRASAIVALALLLLATLIPAGPAGAGQHWNCKTFTADLTGAVVLLEVDAAADGKTHRVGTGFIVNEQGWILTNNHVACHNVDPDRPGGVCPRHIPQLRGKLKAKVGTKNATSHDVRVIKRDPELDLALLRLPLPKGLAPGDRWAFAPLADSNSLGPGQRLIVAGFPFDLDLQCDEKGAVKEINAAHGWAISSHGVNPGNSGGPVFNADGKVVGVVHGVREGAQNIDFFIPINYARGLLILIGPRWLAPS